MLLSEAYHYLLRLSDNSMLKPDTKVAIETLMDHIDKQNETTSTLEDEIEELKSEIVVLNEDLKYPNKQEM